MYVKQTDEELLISYAVGYMLKVIKAKKIITKYRDEFNAIKHGDYDKFFALLKQPYPEVLLVATLGPTGETLIKSDNFSQKSGDCDMAMIEAVRPGLEKFLPECFEEYGDIKDTDISNSTFKKCAAFELAIRVHNNNQRAAKSIPYDKQATFHLRNVIDELCLHKGISESEKELLHGGRKFLNMIKHPKGQFPSYDEGIKAFELAWEVCRKHTIKMM